MSSLIVNFDKSELMPVGNVHNAKQLAKILRCKIGDKVLSQGLVKAWPMASA